MMTAYCQGHLLFINVPALPPSHTQSSGLYYSVLTTKTQRHEKLFAPFRRTKDDERNPECLRDEIHHSLFAIRYSAYTGSRPTNLLNQPVPPALVASRYRKARTSKPHMKHFSIFMADKYSSYFQL